MRRFGKLSAGLFAAMFLVNGATAWAGELADTVYHNGRIYTLTESKADIDANNPDMAEVVAVKGGIIKFVGSRADAEAQGYLSTDEKQVSKLVDLNGKTMYPGFIDGHGHFHDMGPNDLYKVNLNSPLLDGTVKCIDDIIRLMKAQADVTDTGKVVEGWNYDDTMLEEMRHPTVDDLKAIDSDHPIYLRHISGHVAVVNQVALDIAKAKKVDFSKYNGILKDKDGNPTGVLIETAAMDAVNNTLNEFRLPQDTQASIARCAQTYAAAGVTTADAGATAALNVVPDYQQAIAEGNLPIRVLVHPMGIYESGPMDGIGWAGRAQLGWKNIGTAPAAPSIEDQMAMMTGDIRDSVMAVMGYDWYTDGSNAKQLGEDLTNYPVVKVNIQGLPHNVDVANSSPAYTPESPLPENRLMLGAWKLLFDGSPQAYSAWMKSPGYYDWGTYKVPAEDINKGDYLSSIAPNNLSVPVLEKWLGIYHKNGQSTEIHCNGSAASEAWVAALEKAVLANPSVQDTRHTSIHAQTMELQHVARVAGNYADADELVKSPSVTDLMGVYDEANEISKADKGKLGDLMKKQNIFLSFFDNHVYFYGDRHRDIFFGPGRAMNISPTGWAEHYGIPYSFHNDTFVTPISPLRSITSAVTRLTADGELLTGEGKDIWATENYAPRKEEGKTFEEIPFPTYDHRINALQALHAVTTGPAWQNKVDDRLGMIREGYLADFTIMDKDILQQADEDDGGKEIVNMRIAATIVDDKVVYGVLPDATNFAFDAGLSHESAAAGAELTGEPEVLTAEEVEGAAGKDEALLGAVSMEAKVEKQGDTAVFSFKVLGNGETLDKIKLRKLLGNDWVDFSAYSVAGDANDGNWWVNSFDKPLVTDILKQEAVLEKDKVYIVSFAIGDGQAHDGDNEVNGVIVAPVALVGSTAPDNGTEATQVANASDTARPVVTKITPPASKSSGGSSGGCTVGTNPAYELLALLLASLGVMAGRIFRRRNA